MKATPDETPNPAGKRGKPIALPPTTFEDAVKKMLTTPPLPKETKPKKTTASRKK